MSSFNIKRFLIFRTLCSCLLMGLLKKQRFQRVSCFVDVFVFVSLFDKKNAEHVSSFAFGFARFFCCLRSIRRSSNMLRLRCLLLVFNKKRVNMVPSVMLVFVSC